MTNEPIIVEFISASTAGIVNVQLGFTPERAILITAHDDTNPDQREWFNVAYHASWAAGKSLLTTGSSGANTVDAASMTAYAGGLKITVAETVNSSPKHIDTAGTAHSGDGTITAAGIAIPAGDQVNGKRNILIAWPPSY